MKRLLLATLLAASPLLSMAQVSVGVNLNIGDPNFYGQVDLENGPPPPVMYSTPVVVQPAPPGVYYPPVYLRVPTVYYQNWPQYCGMYNACYQPVFFVQENWYMHVYAPMYRSRYPHGRPGFAPRAFYNQHGGPGPRVEERRDEHGGQRHEDRHEEHREEDHR
ncbi:hypothetical protein [Solimicrobium silvestre]|uniref:Uncharacterized protein n=1 Tax=Solimicrobium silvestre TaxID=2099400 RepID=A0A2S9GXN0_9BURK|nr:hypothetical protein [Solimicrobium silvestre]PRC92416.1 hypothetical protein S2091_2791 [Solimicrobium silvestre]